MEADIFEAAWSLWNLESSLTEALLMVAVQSLKNENIQRFNPSSTTCVSPLTLTRNSNQVSKTRWA